MKRLMPILFLVSGLSAAHFESSEQCKACHPVIYEEFQTTQHANASVFDDEIHGAVWRDHPQNIKMSSYTCAKCHTPATDNYEALVAKGNGVVPDKNNTTQREGISCAYCHRIEDIEYHEQSNTNIISKESKSYFGTLKSHIDSPFHKIRTDSKHFDNGNVCIGCHSHKKNKFGTNVCSTNIENELDGSNCVSCHMPKVEGSVSVLRETEKHTFHGFPGTHTHRDMLSHYVDLKVIREAEGFKVIIENKSSHALSLHPMRVMQLRVNLIRGGSTKALESKNFARIIGDKGEPRPPWLAKKEVSNNAIKAHEKREIGYPEVLQKGDIVEITLGYYLVNPKMLKSLDLEKNEVATKFQQYKKERIEIKE